MVTMQFAALVILMAEDISSSVLSALRIYNLYLRF